MTEIYPLLIDSRVGSKELQPYINPAITPTLCRLEYADVSFFGNGYDSPNDIPNLVNIGIERKTITDLISSIESGRLSGHQLTGLINSYNYVYLLVEGLWQSNPKTGILEIYKAHKWQAFEHGRPHTGTEINNYLNTLAVKCNVKIWRTSDIRQSGRWISDLYLWWQKSWDKHKAHQQSYQEPEEIAPLIPATPMQNMLKAGIKNLGWKKARIVSEEFPTMLDLALADVKVLTALPGIGKIQASKILETVRGK